MSESAQVTARIRAQPNPRDPLVERLIGPGKPFEIEQVEARGVSVEVFKGAPRTLAEIYARAAAFGDQPLAVHNGVRLSYAEVLARAASLAHGLADHFAVTPGTTVALVMGNRIEWAISLIAVTALGGVAALINSRGAGEELNRAMALAGCTLAILDRERAAVLEQAPGPGPLPRIFIGGLPEGARPAIDAAFEDLIAADAGRPLPRVEVEPSDGAVVLFTSGTTGFPKGALISHGAIAHAITLSGFMGSLQDLRLEVETGETLPVERRAMTSPAVILSPMFHLSGMMPVIRVMSVGATFHIVDKWNVDTAFDMIEHIGLSRLGFVPTMLWDMLRSPRAGPQNLGAVQHVVNGGAPLNAALLIEMKARMPRALITSTYGQTENAGWACSISGAPYLAHPDACGWACPTVEVSVRRDDGSEAAEGEPGELWVRSAAVMTGYVNDPKATAETLKGGWCASGDVGFVDAEGVFTIVDRKKNMVISGGENIYCAEVERVLHDHPSVKEAIAYGLPDPRLGERLVATVVLTADSATDEDALKAYCRGRLAIYKTPREIRLAQTPLPRTASGKVDRGLFARRLQETAAS